jgi:hypothetical protein
MKTTSSRNPQILIATDLAQGDVVFLGVSGWERDHRLARVAHGSVEAMALESFAKAEALKNIIVDGYLTDVAISADGAPTPLHYREKMRVVGPSVRRDLGKRAWLKQSGEGQ